MDRSEVENRMVEVEFVPETFSVESSAKYFPSMESTKKALTEPVLNA